MPPGSVSPGGPPPSGPPRRPGSILTSPRLTAALALLIVVLVAIIVVPSLNLPRIVLIFGDQTTPPAATAPPSPGSPTVAPSSTFTRPTPTPAPTFTSYVVRAGDSLGSIATLFRTTARSIAWWNRGTYPNLDPESSSYNPNLIVPGWTLILIPGVVVDDEHPPSPSPGRATPTPATTASPATSGAVGSGSPSGGSPSPAAGR